eukprot:scaffold311839_cov33-Tisochrysis_lutea.AAC.2
MAASTARAPTSRRGPYQGTPRSHSRQKVARISTQLTPCEIRNRSRRARRHTLPAGADRIDELGETAPSIGERAALRRVAALVSFHWGAAHPTE